MLLTIDLGIMKLFYTPLQNKEKKMNFDQYLNALPAKINSELEAARLLSSLPLLRQITSELKPDTIICCDIKELNAALEFYKGQEHRIRAFHVLGLKEEIKNKNAKIIPFTTFTKEDNIHCFFLPDLRPACTAYRNLSIALSKLNIQEYTIEAKSASKFYRRNSFIFINNMLQTAIDNYNVLEDNLSRYTYLAVWKSRHVCNPGYIPMAEYDQYWHPLVCAKENDIICEGGPCDGRTTVEFTQKLNHSCQIVTFEPDPQYYKNTAANCGAYPNIEIVAKGLYDFTGTLYINTDNYVKVVKQKIKEEDFECPVTSIDDYFLNTKYDRVDFIKMDIEGAELNALMGAKQILRRDKPNLAICIYHNRIDFITIPEFLRKLDLGYKLYAGHHRPWYAETVVYATAR